MVTAGRRVGGATSRAHGKEDEETSEQDARRRLALERLRRAAAEGDYDGLLDPALWRLLDAAALTVGFGREIGALRFAMARLLAEEEDPRQLSLHLARITMAIIRVTHARPPITPAEDPVRAALLAGLDDLGDSGDRPGGAGDPDDDPDDDEATEPEGEDDP